MSWSKALARKDRPWHICGVLHMPRALPSVVVRRINQAVGQDLADGEAWTLAEAQASAIAAAREIGTTWVAALPVSVAE